MRRRRVNINYRLEDESLLTTEARKKNNFTVVTTSGLNADIFQSRHGFLFRLKKKTKENITNAVNKISKSTILLHILRSILWFPQMHLAGSDRRDRIVQSFTDTARHNSKERSPLMRQAHVQSPSRTRVVLDFFL